MHNDIVIQAQAISKAYRLGTINTGTLYRDLQSWWARWRGREDPNARLRVFDESRSPSHVNDRFLALEDITFDVRRGERLGVIGRNGAGKSTLLKILSRITPPTSGTARIRGRVASLLEVGTGFHTELTGRENVFLNGAILGMNKAEIARKFDEIVGFAEIEKFIDTPVKRYSSGMHVRLAFAVAAHLEPEILIIDEVLAVGDAKFQRKCLGKMEDVSQSGRTILFVSHNMGAITSLCSRCIMLQAGKLIYDGSTSEAVMRYHTSGAFSTSHLDAATSGGVIGDDLVQLVSASVQDQAGNISAEFELDDAVLIVMSYRVLRSSDTVIVPNFHFLMPDGSYAFFSAPTGLTSVGPGEYRAVCRIPARLLNDGTYFVGVATTTYAGAGHYSNFWEKGALCFHVREDLDRTAEYRYGYTGLIPGAVRPKLEWDVHRLAGG